MLTQRSHTQASDEMKRIKEAESRETSSLSAALAPNKPSGKLSRGSRLEQQRSERLGSGGSSLGSGGSGRGSGRPGYEGPIGVAAAADWGEKERSAQQLAWWRGTPAPKERQGSGGNGPPPRNTSRRELKKG